MPLHHQKSRAREILVNEHPGLHLLWYYEKIFVKPIPAYFYSQAFWDYLATADENVYKAAVGFMRSYTFLIQFPIDFVEAVRVGLIPPKENNGNGNGKELIFPTYEEFCNFIEPFSHIRDPSVNRRYHYGELRLTRINRAAIFKMKLAYFHIYPQWGSFLAHILAPVITIFAVASVALNSMQVALAALEMGPMPDSGWPAFIDVSLWFPIATIILIALVIAVGIGGVVLMGIKDLLWSNTTRHRRKKGDPNAGEKSYGMIW